MKKLISTTALTLLLTSITTISFGKKLDNEISFEITGGLSSICYSSELGSYKPMAGTSAGINYLHRFNSNWGIGTGASFRLYQSRMNFGTFNDSYITTTTIPPVSTGSDINNFRFDYSYINLQDKQQAFYLSIPIFAQYEHDSGFYTRLGAQVNIPLGGGSDISCETLKTSGYFPYENHTYTDLPSHGFAMYYDTGTDVALSYLVNASLYAEVGWNWDWNDRFILYLGLNGEYGIGSIYDRDSTAPQLQYNDGRLDYTPIWNATITDGNGERKTITGTKYNNYAFGIVLRYSFGW